VLQKTQCMFMSPETLCRAKDAKGTRGASVLDLDDDVLDTITSSLVANDHGSSLLSLAAVHALSSTCKQLVSLRHAFSARTLANAAVRELLSSARMYAEPPDGLTTDPNTAAVIDLSGRKLGRLECELISCGLQSGFCNTARTLWLQNHQIDAECLCTLARALRRLPPGSKLQSVSLGMNPCVNGVQDSSAQDKLERKALAKLTRSATRRRVQLRLWS